MSIRQGCVFSFEKMQPPSKLEIILSPLSFQPLISKLVGNPKCDRGPNGYLVDSKLNTLIATRVYKLGSFIELLERLKDQYTQETV